MSFVVLALQEAHPFREQGTGNREQGTGNREKEIIMDNPEFILAGVWGVVRPTL
jgi:hypothetical protein